MGVVERWLSGPVYEGSLSTLIGTALHEDRFDTFVEQAWTDGQVRIAETDVPSDYFEKVLAEEVENQFGNELRPFIELVSNAIDARPDDYTDDEYTVGVDVTRSSVTVADEGASMGLEDLLQTLIIPFHSEKDAAEDIGRFGVGFFSNLSYCLDNPGEATVTVDTTTADESYRTTFWSDSGDVADLQVRIEPGPLLGTRGTRVTVDGVTADLGDLPAYLDDYFGSFDPERAVITHGFDRINELPDGDTYRVMATLPGDDGPLEQQVRLTIDPTDTSDDAGVNTYAQGVFVSSRRSPQGSAHISLPPAVELVEGRNAFNRKSDRYETAIQAVYDQLVDYVEDVDDPAAVDGLRQLVPAIKRETRQNFRYVQRNAMGDALFPDDTYVLDGEAMVPDHAEADITAAARFFGSGTDANLYGARTATELGFWTTEFPGMAELVEDYTDDLVHGDLETVQAYADAHDIPFHNTDVLSEDLDYKLVDVDTDTPAASPFLSIDRTLYVRHDHPYFRLEDHSPSKHALYTQHKRACDVTERQIENSLLRRHVE
jgi:hypothetical protein